MKIKNIKAIEILDSRGRPTIRTFIFLDNDIFSSSSIPSGASTGSNEALELRDNNKKRYHGLGVLKAVENVNKIIAPKLIGQTLDDSSFEKIDKMMIEIDGTKNKSNLGANSILSVSQALLRVYSLALKKPLWQIINQIYFSNIAPSFPRLMVNVINGGKHAGWNFDIQEFMISPVSNKPSEAVRTASEIFQQLGKNLKEKKLSTLVGDEGGYSPALSSNKQVLEEILKSAFDLGYKNNVDFNLALDSAASEFYQDRLYFFKKENKKMTNDELSDYYQKLKEKYQIFSFEDPFAENDWSGFKKFTEKIGSIVIGDDIYTTDPVLIKKAIKEKISNAVLIKPNQIGTIYETAQSINLAKKAAWKVAISHRSGETEDSFIADLAYGCAADFIKTGSMSRSERLAKYNRLIEIENNL
ncbi:MAG: phosphopyruvate hydratase [Patescibacteria group bacterium]|nr:phosphopyruvate hydratase [Patescibacteria group bacterium]